MLKSTSHATHAPELVGRIMWMMLGPFAVAIAAALVISEGGGWLTPYDLAFFAALGAMLLGRCLEFRGGNPQTADGQPATPAQLLRYLLIAGIVGLALWAVCNVVGNNWLTT